MCWSKIRHILNSTVKTKILLSLYNGKKSVDTLNSEIDRPKGTISNTLRDLRRSKLVDNLGKCFFLRPYGYLATLNMIKLIEDCHNIKSNFDFWKNHNISDIPSEFIRRHNSLRKTEFISSDNVNLVRPLSEYINLIYNAKDLKIILPIFSEAHLDSIISSLTNNCNLKLIITDEILRLIHSNGYFEKLFTNELKNLNIWKIDTNLKIFMTSSENFFTLSLFFENGDYDDSKMIINRTNLGIMWGNDIFNYFKQKSKRIS